QTRGISERAERTSVAARDRHREDGRHRHAQQGDRIEPGHRRGNGQVSSPRHLRETRRAWPCGADALRLRARADRAALYRKIDPPFHPTVLTRLRPARVACLLRLAWQY